MSYIYALVVLQHLRAWFAVLALLQIVSTQFEHIILTWVLSGPFF